VEHDRDAGKFTHFFLQQSGSPAWNIL